ncbi:MAG: membrane protein insertion efficiency factor YidD [Candidatus Nealsonbacteria bacterium]
MIKFFILALIRTYQTLVSPLLGKYCRFYPTCSVYAFSVVQKYGWRIGSIKSARRLLKCHRWHPGGVDLP